MPVLPVALAPLPGAVVPPGGPPAPGVDVDVEGEGDGLLPAPPAAPLPLLRLMLAFVSMKLDALLLPAADDDPAAPEVPVGAVDEPPAACTHPTTVIVCAVPL